MARQILEGKWEEIALHAEELAGRRVRLIVLPDMEAPTSDRPRNGAVDPTVEGAMIRRGMFPQLKALTEEDFIW